MESRFDLLAKLVAGATSGVSRREALRRLGGAAAGAALTYLGIGCDVEPTGPEAGGHGRSVLTARGRCKKIGQKCRQNSECCSELCDPLTGYCACAPGTFLCPASGQCVPCGASFVLNPDSCTCECPSGSGLCGGSVCCAHTCCSGSCCTAGQVCVEIFPGVRLCQNCQSGTVPCGTTCCAAAQCCNDVCCPTGRVCVNGQCECPGGTTDCDGTCVNLSTDPTHCGTCDTVCATGTGIGACCSGVCCAANEICDNGSCAPCASGLTACNGVCVDLSTNPAHCGECNRPCSGLETCIGGFCQSII